MPTNDELLAELRGAASCGLPPPGSSATPYEKRLRKAIEDVLDAFEPDACPVCLIAFKPDDMCLTDIELGACHAECLAGSPMVDLDTGDPLPEGSPPPEPYRYDSLFPSSPAPDAWQHQVWFDDTKTWSEWRPGRHDPNIGNAHRERALYQAGADPGYTHAVASKAKLADEVTRLRDALVAARMWHESEHKGLSKQPPSSGPNGTQWAMLQHREQIDEINAALAAVPRSWDICVEFNNRDGYTGIRRWTRDPAQASDWRAEPNAGRFVFYTEWQSG